MPSGAGESDNRRFELNNWFDLQLRHNQLKSQECPREKWTALQWEPRYSIFHLMYKGNQNLLLHIFKTSHSALSVVAISLWLDCFTETTDTHSNDGVVLGMWFPGATGDLLVGTFAVPDTNSWTNHIKQIAKTFQSSIVFCILDRLWASYTQQAKYTYGSQKPTHKLPRRFGLTLR